jgi:casein kinase I family protein HRR25
MVKFYKTQNILELSRRDDLESLIYLLTYLALGNLPWICLMSAKSQSVSSHLIKQQKIKVRGEELCKDMPSNYNI